MQANPQAVSGYSDDTEILTRDGWVTFPQLTYMSEVATRSPEGRFEWQHPEKITCQPYEGDMVWFHGRSLDLLVTPGHRMLWAPDCRGKERFATGAELLQRGASVSRPNAGAALVVMSTWDAPDLAEKVFRGVRRSKMGPKPRDLHMTGDQFAAFMGMYMAEGCVGQSRGKAWFADICQMAAGKGYEEYRDLLVAIVGHEPGRTGNCWRIYSRPLYEYLHPFGNSLTKWLPHDVLNLSLRQLKIFWRYYWLGDGTWADGGLETVATASRALADDVQEVIQKLGWSASVRLEKYRPTAITNVEGVLYKLSVCRTRYPQGSVSSQPYAGLIGHAEVGDRAVYVRRSRRPVWT